MAKAKTTSRGKTAPKPSEVRKFVRSLRKQPWACEVDVYLTAPGSQPPFEHQSSLEMNSSKRLIFKNRRRPGFIIKFRLNDDLNPGYRFPSDPTQAVWSQAGSVCPNAGIWDVFSPIGVEDAGMTLLVYNANPKPRIGDFKFCLNVTKNDLPPYLWLDPGGDNQNGNSN